MAGLSPRANELVGASALNLVGKVIFAHQPQISWVFVSSRAFLQSYRLQAFLRQTHTAHGWPGVRGCLTGRRAVSCFTLQALREMDSSPR